MTTFDPPRVSDLFLNGQVRSITQAMDDGDFSRGCRSLYNMSGIENEAPVGAIFGRAKLWKWKVRTRHHGQNLIRCCAKAGKNVGTNVASLKTKSGT
jgi:hypothetical protein